MAELPVVVAGARRTVFARVPTWSAVTLGGVGLGG
jgi:hypothetical protein